jgi:hypothetical protein
MSALRRFVLRLVNVIRPGRAEPDPAHVDYTKARRDLALETPTVATG